MAQRCSVAPHFPRWSKKSASKVSFRWSLRRHLDSNNILKPKQECDNVMLVPAYYFGQPQHKLGFSSSYVQLELDRIGGCCKGSVSALVQGIFKMLDDACRNVCWYNSVLLKKATHFFVVNPWKEVNALALDVGVTLLLSQFFPISHSCLVRFEHLGNPESLSVWNHHRTSDRTPVGKKTSKT